VYNLPIKGEKKKKKKKEEEEAYQKKMSQPPSDSNHFSKQFIFCSLPFLVERSDEDLLHYSSYQPKRALSFTN
jgi:hypothetical protein